MKFRNALAALYRFLLKIFVAKGFTKIPLFKKLNIWFSLYLRTHRPQTVFVDGHTIHLDPIDSLSLTILDYEPYARELVREYTKKGDIFVDIGANIGVFTLLAARCVGPEGKVYAFEPEPKNFSLLTENVRTNRYANVIPVNKAVAEKTKEVRLFFTDFNAGGHSLFNPYSDPERFVYPHISEKEAMTERSIISSAITLDEFFKNDEKINFIKIDVQGAEGLVFEGMQALLRRNPSVKILTEFWPFAMQKLGTDVRHHLEKICSFGFTIFDIDEKQKKLIELTPEGLLGRYPPEKNTSTNIFIMRR